ncbi:MAG: helix-turn-helix transcriptional regulator [Balneolales bacterium]
MAYLTDKELLEHFQFYLLQVECRLREGEDFKTIGKQIPYSLQLNDPKTFEIRNMNKKGTEHVGFTLGEIRDKWNEYIKIVHPSTVENLSNILPALYASPNCSKTLPFVQYVKLFGKSIFSPVISFTKPTSLPNGMHLWLSSSPCDLGKKAKEMERVVSMDEFKLKNFKRFQTLTKREVEILQMLANGCDNPAIAEQLFISRQTVETHRKNLRIKLDLNSYRDLMKYAFSFNLVQL